MKSNYIAPVLAGATCLALFTTPGSVLARDKNDLEFFTRLDTFAYSEAVSVTSFVKDFDDNLEDGDTAFTHDSFEVGVRWRDFSFSAVKRFDYVTGFTTDTALFHHTEKNGGILDQSREYNLLLDVERVTATGFKGGYRYTFNDDIKLNVAFSYYPTLTSLQSGSAGAIGDLEPLTAALEAEVRQFIDGLDANNRDLTPLKTIVRDVNAKIIINYAYDDPKFGEPFYRKPVVDGPPNPVISGVNFDSPDGSGYALDAGISWQVNDRLRLEAQLWDIVNKFSWDNAPLSYAEFSLNSALLDVIDVAQLLVDGAVLTPNDLVDRQLFVDIRNEDYTQELPWRGDLSAHYDLDYQPAIFGWEPNLGLRAGYYRTGTKDFPRIGIQLDKLSIDLEATVSALSVAWQGDLFQVRLVTDKLNTSDARTLGLSVGFSLNF